MQNILIFAVWAMWISHGFSLDINWSSLQSDGANLSNPFGKKVELKTQTVKKIKRKVDNPKSKVNDIPTLPTGYPSSPPYTPGRNPGFFKVIKHLQGQDSTSLINQEKHRIHSHFTKGERHKTQDFEQISKYSGHKSSFLPSVNTSSNYKPKRGQEKFTENLTSLIPKKNNLKVTKSLTEKGQNLKSISQILKEAKHRPEIHHQILTNISSLMKEKSLPTILETPTNSLLDTDLLNTYRPKAIPKDQNVPQKIFASTHRNGFTPLSIKTSAGLPQENITDVSQLRKSRLCLSQQKTENKIDEGTQTSPHSRKNMMFGALLEDLKLKAFLALIRRANLDPMLTTEGEFTIFAPSDSAFKMLTREVLLALEENTEKLREVILYHVAPGRLFRQDLLNELVLASAAPAARRLRLNVYDFGSDFTPVVTVNGARLKSTDHLASNVVVHVIDRVLYPMAEASITQHLASCDEFNGVNAAVRSSYLTSLLDQEGPFTFFAPSTQAFALIDDFTVNEFVANISLLQDVLLFHAVPGTFYSEGLRDGEWLPTFLSHREVQVRVTSDGISRRLSGVGRDARILKADIPAVNGVIHLMDLVLQPEMENPICGHF